MTSLALAADEQEMLAKCTPAQRDAAFALDRRFRALAKPLQAALRSLAAQISIPHGTLQRRYYDWRKTGILACLDKRSCATAGRNRASAEVIEFWKSMQLDYQRGTSLLACHRQFVRLWREGKIPCLSSDCAVDPGTGLPPGCHYRALVRKKLTKYQAKAVRIGKHSASQLLPKVLTTRVGLLPGQVVEFDDQEHDVQVAFEGVNRSLTRPGGFHTLDYLSGCDTLQSFKPTIRNPDGTRQKLRQIDFEWFVVAYATQIGYRADTGTEFIWERGTSKSSSAFLERLFRATNDKVSVRMSGLHREPALAGLFHGPAKGNPRVKGARECWFRLFREESAALPAPTGKDRDHAPEGSEALKREAQMLLAAMRALPPERAELLRLPCLTWTQFTTAANLIVRLINERVLHHLEGWEELGFLTHEWRLNLQSPWLSQEQYLQLPGPEKQIFNGLMRQTPELWRTRRRSPLEVWQAGRRELTRVSGSAIPLLFGPEHARSERVEDDLSIVIKDREISPTPLVYDAVLTNGRHLERRQSVAIYLNPFAPESLQVCDENLRWMGAAPLVQRFCKTDFEAGTRRYNRIRKIASEELAPIARLGAGITQRESARLTNNAKVLDTARDFTPEEKQASRERRANTAPISQFLDDETVEPRPAIASIEDFL